MLPLAGYLENVLTLKEIKLAKFWSKSIVVVKCAPLPLDTNGKEHLPPKHDIVPLLGKLFPVDLSDPKTHAVKMRDSCLASRNSSRQNKHSARHQH